MSFETWLRKTCYHKPTKAAEILARTAWMHQQAKIDRLMLEYCPDEMTPEQIKNYKKNQWLSNS